MIQETLWNFVSAIQGNGPFKSDYTTAYHFGLIPKCQETEYKVSDFALGDWIQSIWFCFCNGDLREFTILKCLNK